MAKIYFPMFALLPVVMLFVDPICCTAQTTINDFSTFSTNGNSEALAAGLPSINGAVLRLTETDANNTSGSAFSNETVDISNGFTAEFTVSFGTPAEIFPGARLAFVVHSDPRGSAALGGSIFGYGTDQISPGLALVFNPSPMNLQNGQFGLRHSGDVPDLGSRHQTRDFAFEPGGNTSTFVTVTFDPIENSLTQTLSGNLGTKTFVTPIGFSQLLDEAYVGEAYVGFTGWGPNGSLTGSISGFSFSTLAAPVILGDVNQDGVVDFADIPLFIDILIAGDYLAEADCNEDGVVDFSDIPAFIEILLAS